MEADKDTTVVGDLAMEEMDGLIMGAVECWLVVGYGLAV